MKDSTTAMTGGRHRHPTRTTLDGALAELDWQDAHGLQHYQPRHCDDSPEGWARNDVLADGAFVALAKSVTA